jgi:DNA-binding XRE family transcriptional regulator
MVTRPPLKNQRQLRPAPRPFFLRQWRKFMGTKAVELAEALGIERESYYRLEKNWWTISTGEQDIIARTIGIKPSQLWFPPPTQGQDVVSLDELVEDMPEQMKKAAINAVKGIAGR